MVELNCPDAGRGGKTDGKYQEDRDKYQDEFSFCGHNTPC